MREFTSDMEISEGTEGTEGTPLSGAGFSGSPFGEPEGTQGTFDPLDAAIDPNDDPTGAELDEKLDFPGEDARPVWKCYWDWCGPKNDAGRRTRQPGVYLHGMTAPKKNEPSMPFDRYVCSPLTVAAVTQTDDAHRTFGLLLEFRDLNGSTRKWAMPRNMLRGSGEELRGELLDQGVQIEDRGRLSNWLQRPPPRRRVIAATRTGWAAEGKAFVLPGRVIGAADKVIFQSESAVTEGAAAARGSYDRWRDEVAAPCVGNTVPTLSICIALSGPLLALLHHPSCGVHWVGDSSIGKTTSLLVGGSVWGGERFIRSWRGTANGLEGAAATLNDCVLCLDEIGQADARVIGDVVYSIINGIGKARATRIGAARKVDRWRLALLSTGEKTLKAQMAEGGKQIKAGQEIRLLNVPTARRHGVFEELHGHADGRSLADRLKETTGQHYGHAGPRFVEQIMATNRDLGAELQQVMALPQFEAGDSQSGRAAKAFAIFGMAGELATEWDILPWEPTAALAAAATCYRSWLDARGQGVTEHRQILEAVSDFIDRHGDSRFSEKGRETERAVINRAGWWMNTPDGDRIYLFNSSALREAGSGYDQRRIIAALDQAGWIVERGSDKVAKRTHVGPGQKPALYYVRIGEVSA